MKPLAILITTYAPPGGKLRIEAVERAVRSWKEHLLLKRKIHVHVSDDGSSSELKYGSVFWRELLGDWASLSYSWQSRSGLGSSINRGLDACQKVSPFILYPMDDWELSYDLDLEPWIKLLEENEEIGCIRMGQPSGSVRGGKGKRFGQRVGIIFDRYAFYWSLSPALYHERFFQVYGPFREGVSPAQTEIEFNASVCKKLEGPDVLVAMFSPWQHLWSLKLGDLEPSEEVPLNRFQATVNTEGYDF